MVLQITPETSQASLRNGPQANQRVLDKRTGTGCPQGGTNRDQQNNETREHLPLHFLHLDYREQALTVPGFNVRNNRRQTQSDSDIIRSQRLAEFREAGRELRNIADDSCNDCKCTVIRETGLELRKIADEIHSNIMGIDRPPDHLYIQERGRRGLKRKSS